MGTVRTTLAVLVAVLASASYAHAASSRFYLVPSATLVAPDSEIAVGVFVDSADPLNAFDIRVGFREDAVEFFGSDNSRSFIDVWQRVPEVSQGGEVRLVGGATRPFSGERGELVTLHFRAKSTSDAQFTFSRIEAYIADGLGTQADVVSESSVVAVAADGRRETITVPEDFEPPAIKALSLIDDPFNPNQKLLNFQVEDRMSGMARVAVRSRRWFLWSQWETARNPVAIGNQVWAVEFRAQDNAGNLAARVVYNWRAFLVRVLPFSLLAAAVMIVFLVFLNRRCRAQP